MGRDAAAVGGLLVRRHRRLLRMELDMAGIRDKIATS